MRKESLFCFFVVASLILAVSIAGITASPTARVYVQPAFIARPQASLVSGITVTDAAKAYDGDETTYAYFNTDADGYFNLTTFTTIVTGQPVHVDLYIKYSSVNKPAPNNDDKYRIVQYVSPSTTRYVLRDWTTSATAVSAHIDIFGPRPEPNNGVWEWTDVGNIKVAFDSDVVGVADARQVKVYEVWAVVAYDPGVDGRIVDTTKTVGTKFAFSIMVADVMDLYTFGVKVRWSGPVFNVTRIDEGGFLRQAGQGATYFTKSIFNGPDPIGISDYAIMGNTLVQIPRGLDGGGILATVYCLVEKNNAETALDLYDIELRDSVGVLLAYTEGDGYFSNKLPGDVNGDGKVDASDLSDLSKAYGSTAGPPPSPSWNSSCDFNGDGWVNVSDLFALSRNYGKHNP